MPLGPVPLIESTLKWATVTSLVEEVDEQIKLPLAFSLLEF